jgi:hypothetical protein
MSTETIILSLNTGMDFLFTFLTLPEGIRIYPIYELSLWYAYLFTSDRAPDTAYRLITKNWPSPRPYRLHIYPIQ